MNFFLIFLSHFYFMLLSPGQNHISSKFIFLIEKFSTDKKNVRLLQGFILWKNTEKISKLDNDLLYEKIKKRMIKI